MPKPYAGISQESYKSESFQSAARLLRSIAQQEAGSSEDSLFREFSEMLDKIAARVHQSIREESAPLDAFFVAPLNPEVLHRPTIHASHKEQPERKDIENSEPKAEEEGADQGRHTESVQGHRAETKKKDEGTISPGPQEQVASENDEDLPNTVVSQLVKGEGDQKASLAKTISDNANEKGGQISSDESTPQELLPGDEEFVEVASSVGGEQQAVEILDGKKVSEKKVRSSDGKEYTVASEEGAENSEESALLENTKVQTVVSAEEHGQRIEKQSSQGERATEKQGDNNLASNSFLTAALLASNLSQGNGTSLTARSAPTEQLNAQILKQATEAIAIQRPVLASGSSSQSSLFGSGGHSMIEQRFETERAKPVIPQAAYLKAFEKVEAALKEAAKAKDGKTISLKLNPDELGSVKVDVTLREGSLHARLSADATTVNNLLRERAHDLQQVLRRLGLNIERVTVSVHGEGEVPFESNWKESSSSFTHNQETSDFGERKGGQGSLENSSQWGDSPKVVGMVSGEPIDHWVA